MIDLSAIYVDQAGRPVPGRPEPLGATASVQERIEWLRAVAAYSDRITAVGNAAFDRGFREGLRRV